MHEMTTPSTSSACPFHTSISRGLVKQVLLLQEKVWLTKFGVGLLAMEVQQIQMMKSQCDEVVAAHCCHSVAKWKWRDWTCAVNTAVERASQPALCRPQTGTSSASSS